MWMLVSMGQIDCSVYRLYIHYVYIFFRLIQCYERETSCPLYLLSTLQANIQDVFSPLYSAFCLTQANIFLSFHLYIVDSHKM